VFEPHVRLGHGREQNEAGLGLGLGIARSIVQAQGGQLRLDNHPQGGLVATVHLPPAGSMACRCRDELKSLRESVCQSLAASTAQAAPGGPTQRKMVRPPGRARIASGIKGLAVQR
jgi:hypothetical protein